MMVPPLFFEKSFRVNITVGASRVRIWWCQDMVVPGGIAPGTQGALLIDDRQKTFQ